MPFLRFTRDKRGYETTSLVHAVRHGGRSRQRILYWFRTPPGVKVGRPALDEDAIRWIEEHNPDLKGVLPRDYGSFEKPVLVELLRLIGSIPDDIEGDAFGKIYEYFLGNFAMTEGHRGSGRLSRP